MSEFLRGLFRLARNPQIIDNNTAKTEIPRKWDYNLFREYLLALTRGEEFLLPIADYPEEIDLNSTWHEALDSMRTKSTDGIERLCVIGGDLEGRKVIVQVIPATGKNRHVPSHVTDDQVKKALKVGADVVLGDIHSHPAPLYWRYGLSSGKMETRACFSAADLYLLVRKYNKYFIGIVQGHENLFAFRSRESKARDRLTYLGLKTNKRNVFQKYWWGQVGVEFINDEDGEKVERRSTNGDTLPFDEAYTESVNFQIATRHNFVLYKGTSGGKLLRL